MNWFDRFLMLQFTWRDAIDIAIVGLILYNILALIRGTRAMQMSIGLVFLGSTFFVAKAFDLAALEAISREILFYLPFAVIVLFQHEIRQALSRMGRNPLLALFTRRTVDASFDPVLNAVEILASRRIGALIVLERTQSLRMYIDGAKALDAIVTPELLVAIFIPGGPMHDGAVIIQGQRVAAAGAFLPLTASADPTLAHGTRHRAALGLSEESDALIIVVSEENGSLAVASEGVLRENLDRASLAAIMRARLAAGSGNVIQRGASS